MAISFSVISHAISVPSQAFCGQAARGRDLQPLDALLISSADPIHGLRFNILDL